MVANIVAIKKPNVKGMVYIDFIDLNDAHPKGNYPLPSTDKLFSKKVGHGMLSLMDDYTEYNQIHLAEEGQ